MSCLRILLLLLISSSLFAQTSMFRGSADHMAAVQSSGNPVFGEEAWKFNASAAVRSSVAWANNTIYFGTSRGEFFALDAGTGAVKWTYTTGHAINSSPAFFNGKIFFADNKQSLYALHAASGKVLWRTDFEPGISYEWAFDYFYSSPTIADNKIFIGSKDGHLYAISPKDGKILWKYKTTGIVRSTPAVQDGVVYVGSTEGILYAVRAKDGAEVWKFLIAGNAMKNEDFGFDRRAIISSPVVTGNKVLAGGRDGFLYAVNKDTGKRLNNFQAGGVIFTAPVVKDSLLYFGCDDGFLYALKPAKYTYPALRGIKKFVYWEPGINNYFRNGTDVTVREYLAARNYTISDGKQIATWMAKQDSAVNSVIVFASNYFPEEITKGYEQSILRKYLQNGGKVVLLGNNPLIFHYDAASRQPIGFNVPMADSVLSLRFGPNDTRAFRGSQPAFPTAEGEKWGLRKSWTASLPVPAGMADIILGKDENGLSSAWVKRYHRANGSGLVQIWVHPDGESNLNFIERVAEFGLGEN